MRKYQVNRDKEKAKLPSKEKMQQYKDFSKLSHRYEKLTKRPKKPLYKDPKIFIALILIVVIVFLIVDSEKKDSKEKQEPKKEMEKDSLGSSE